LGPHFRTCRSPLEPCACDLKRYWFVFSISLLILAIEIRGGFSAGSLALFSDAGHVFSDLLSLTVAIIIEAMVRATLLFIVALGIIFEAISRFHEPHHVTSWIVICAATLGAGLNWLQHRILESSTARHVTHKGISLHVLSDLWQSIAVIVTGILIAITGFTILDLLVSIAIAVVFIGWSFKLLGDSTAEAEARD
jgi:cobalt-zinc-cadmium efflux system protein